MVAHDQNSTVGQRNSVDVDLPRARRYAHSHYQTLVFCFTIIPLVISVLLLISNSMRLAPTVLPSGHVLCRQWALSIPYLDLVASPSLPPSHQPLRPSHPPAVPPSHQTARRGTPQQRQPRPLTLTDCPWHSLWDSAGLQQGHLHSRSVQGGSCVAVDAPSQSPQGT